MPRRLECPFKNPVASATVGFVHKTNVLPIIPTCAPLCGVGMATLAYDIVLNIGFSKQSMNSCVGLGKEGFDKVQGVVLCTNYQDSAENSVWRR